MVIADTGLWVALFHTDDRHHALAVDVIDNLAEPLITTWPVITETCHLITRSLGAIAQAKFIESIAEGATSVFALSEHHIARMSKLIRSYSDLPMDLADASLVVLAEEIGSGKILSTDRRDFKTYRWKNRKPFQNLLFPND